MYSTKDWHESTERTGFYTGATVKGKVKDQYCWNCTTQVCLSFDTQEYLIWNILSKLCEGYWTLKHTMMVKTFKLNSRLLRMGIYAVHIIMHCVIVLRTHVPSMRTSSPTFYDFFSHKKSFLFFNDGFPYLVLSQHIETKVGVDLI